MKTYTVNGTSVEGGSQIGFAVERAYYYTGGSSKTVNISIGGTASGGTDYAPSLTSPMIIPQNQIAVTNWITPLSDTNVEGVETVTVSVLPGNYYVVDSSSSNVTAYINDDYPTINVEANDNYARENQPGSFLINRIGNMSRSVTAQLNITGTATSGTDFSTLPTTVTLGAGVSSTNLAVVALHQTGLVAAKTVVLSLKTNASYVLGLQTNAVVTIAGTGPVARDSYPKTDRYIRGSGTNLDLYTMVIPLDGINGTRRSEIEALGYTTVYHYSATNAGNQLYATNRIAFNTPIVSFGDGWGTPLYLGRSYSLGSYYGMATLDPIVINAYRRSDGLLIGSTNISYPDVGSVTSWTAYASNAFTKTVVSCGLTTVFRTGPDLKWGTSVPGFVLTHTATDEATNYVFLIAAAGLMNSQYAAINAANQPAYGYLYELNFGALPGWRSVFIDQPHFQGSPLPPDLLNKTPDELFNFGAAVTNAISLAPSACTNIDQSPELRRHPILDQFIADLNRDPLALANYVQNEIELTDPMGYRENGQVETEAVYQGGVNRGALGVYLEGQGSPMEQCALLIYLLRQAGYPATYVFPPDGGLKMLDTRLSALVRMRINGADDNLGRLYTTNQLITVNYPWVAAYVNNQWVHIFPWLKDYSVEEGLNIYGYLPDPYKQMQLWVRDYVLGKTNITAFATLSDDTPSTIFPRWLDDALKKSAPGVSVDDIGMRYVNRRHLYAQWSDFPRPTWVTNTSTAVESLASSGVTNVSPALTNVFDTVQVQLYSVANPQKSVLTPPLRMADLHNRKFFLTHTNLGNGLVQAQLILGPYVSGNPNQGAFSVSDATLTNRQVLTLNFDDTDDDLKLRIRHRRQRAISWETALDLDRTFLGLVAERELLVERPLRKGDSAAICLNPGRVSPAMLRVHAQELWNMEKMLSTNALATNQVSADVYQGSLLYLEGMNYYERAARGGELLQKLFKVRPLSRFAMGLSKLSPRRNANGTLYGGALDLIWPNVDMFFYEAAIAGNGMVRQDSGWTKEAAERNYFALSSADLSAQEHAVLNIFFGQSNSVSTVKMLQLAQAKAASGGSNVVEVNVYNVTAAGNVLYNGIALQNHDPEMWSQVIDTFVSGGAPEYTVGWLTPGSQTTPSGSFSGMAAFVLAPYSHLAAINNQNGAYTDALKYGADSPPNLGQWVLGGKGSDYTLSLSTPLPSSYQVSEQSPLFQILHTTDLFGNSTYAPTPFQNLWGQVSSYYYNTPSSGYSIMLPISTDLGLNGIGPVDWQGNGGLPKVADPVNSLTGEFYVDDVDLSLPGPMPLQVRRNYGSQNLANSQLGFGWKLNYMPFLTVNASNIVYESEPDGSVIAFGLVSSNLWAPSLTLNPTLNNDNANGVGSVANRLNARLVKISTNSVNYYLTNGDGSLRVFQEMSFPLTNSTSWDRLRPYLTTWFDNRGNSYRFEYGTNVTQADYGQVRRIVSSSGNIVRFEYDVYGHIVNAYSADGRRVQYTYDEHGDLVTVTRPDTSQVGYEYQLLTWSTNGVTNVYSTHLLLREDKPDGRVLQNAYDGQRRVTNQLSTVGPDLRLIRSATFRYTNNFNLTNLTATLTGSTTILDYTNNPTTYFYTNGLIRRIVDPLGGQLVQDWYEMTETNVPAYPRSLKSLTDRRGLVTTFFYDTQGNVTNTTVRGDLAGDGNTNATAVTIALYNANNLPLQTVNASGTTNLFFYTNTWLLTRVETWPSNATAAQAVTNLYSYTDVTNSADGTMAYRLRSQEIRAAYSSDAATNLWTYSSRGFPIQQTRFTGTADPAVVVTNFYNTRGELAVQTDAAGRSTVFGYDPRGSIQSREVFDTGQTVPMSWDYFYYNENGELTWSDGPRFNPEDYVWRDYDGAGRKSQEIHWRSEALADGSGVQAAADLYATTFYQYDPLNDLTKVIDPLGNYSIKKYDALGRLLREEFYDSTGTLLATNGFVYNLAGDVTNSFNALGGSSQKQYTSSGKPKFQRNADGSTNAWLYYADGRPRREIQRNGAYWETTYDDANRKTTRIFYSASASPLGVTNVSVLDRRGNLIQRVDAGGNFFTNAYDGLDRLKTAAGPAIVTVNQNCGPIPNCGVYVTNVLQQITTYLYDASGKTTTVSNALGEKTVTTYDPIGRVLSVQTYAAGSSSPLRVTATSYTTNHHAVTLTEGTGADAISTTTWTDNDGHTLLAVRHPTGGLAEYTAQAFDRNGNRTESDRLSTDGIFVYVWSFSLFSYDGLNRLKTETARDNAVTTYNYDALGDVTNRIMPGGLKWNAVYNNAGQTLQEWVSGTDGSGTRTNTYSYFTSGNAFAGLLQTSTDGRGVSCAHSYDDFLRPAANVYTGPLTEHNFTTSFGYDARGFLTGVGELPSGYSIVNYSVGRTYDPYGQISKELVGNGMIYHETAQSWDAAGRRTALNFGVFNYSFGWRADGLLGAASTPVGGGTYGYTTAGVLTNRTVGPRTTSVTALDGEGRPLSISTKINGWTKLTESLSWTDDGLLSAHTLDREDFTDSRSYDYDYMNHTRRLVEERLNLDGSKRWTNHFTYDNGVFAGPGALTAIGPALGGSHWNGGSDAWLRVNTETNVNIRRPASGRLNGNATVTASLDGVLQPVAIYSASDPQWANRWRSTLDVPPGAHQLTVSARHPSGLFTTNASVWFTNNAATDRVTDSFDGAGYLTQRVWKTPSGATNRVQTLSWDARGRLVKVTERDANANGFDWLASYDPLGRRFDVRALTVVNGNWSGDVSAALPFFDPQVEFLELGQWVNYQQFVWKLYGPDLNGHYGGLNGTGGLDAVAPGPYAFNPTISDVRGNVLGSVSNGVVAWTPARPTGYGSVPGYRPLPQDQGGDVPQSCAWRGRAVDITGLVWLGARYYNPESGSFLGSDPVWNGRDPNYYTFAGGDPINFFDWDGRCAQLLGGLDMQFELADPNTRAWKLMSQYAQNQPLQQPLADNSAHNRWVFENTGVPHTLLDGPRNDLELALYTSLDPGFWLDMGLNTAKAPVKDAANVIAYAAGKTFNRDSGVTGSEAAWSSFNLAMTVFPGVRAGSVEARTIEAVETRTATQLELNFGQSLPWQRGESGLVVGLNRDLSAPGVLGPGEYRLTWLDWRDPNVTDPILRNYQQEQNLLVNEAKINNVLDINLPIRDASRLDIYSSPYLNLERQAAQSRGWENVNGFWTPKP